MLGPGRQPPHDLPDGSTLLFHQSQCTVESRDPHGAICFQASIFTVIFFLSLVCLVNFFFVDIGYSLYIMASVGQRRGTCGHVMALYDSHLKCALCREKGIGDDPCVAGKDCGL